MDLFIVPTIGFDLPRAVSIGAGRRARAAGDVRRDTPISG